MVNLLAGRGECVAVSGDQEQGLTLRQLADWRVGWIRNFTQHVEF
jgi:hypothetical protein